MPREPLDRRAFVAATVSAGAAAAGLAFAEDPPSPKGTAPKGAAPSAGRLKLSVCRWCYGSMPLDDLCRQAASMGLSSVELLYEKEWATPSNFGLACAVAMGPTTISDGFNRVENHERFVEESARMLPLVRAAGIPNMIVFAGDRRGMSDDEGLRNCERGLRQVMPIAEENGVTIIMELLNSKVDHKDHMCDRTPWGVELVKRVGSDRFRLLYDIYHMQIMEGDVIRTIESAHPYIAHYHTAGNPGRGEIDGGQELHYPAICRAIVETGYTGFLGQEFIPRRDPMTSLREAVEICRVS